MGMIEFCCLFIETSYLISLSGRVKLSFQDTLLDGLEKQLDSILPLSGDLSLL